MAQHRRVHRRCGIERQPDQGPRRRRCFRRRPPGGRGRDAQGRPRRGPQEGRRRDRFIVAVERTGFRQRAAAAVEAVGAALDGPTPRQVGLGREGAGHPLPGEVIAGRIAVDEVAQEPIGPGPPVDATNVHQPGREPHPLVVVEVAGVEQPARECVDARHARRGRGDVGRQVRRPGRARHRRRRLDRRPDAVPDRALDAVPVVAPGQLRDELLRAGRAAGNREGSIPDLRQTEHTVADPGGEPGHPSADVVPGHGVGRRIDPLQGRKRRGAPSTGEGIPCTADRIGGGEALGEGGDELRSFLRHQRRGGRVGHARARCGQAGVGGGPRIRRMRGERASVCPQSVPGAGFNRGRRGRRCRRTRGSRERKMPEKNTVSPLAERCGAKSSLQPSLPARHL